ncbi:MAG: nitrate ABC transporter, permease protein, partial [Burkholderiales bacterium]
MNIFRTQGFKAAVISALLLLAFIGVWYAATAPSASAGAASGMTAEQIEYQKMMGKDPGASSKGSGFP